MGLFDTLKNAIFGHANSSPAPSTANAPPKVNSPDGAAGSQPVSPNAAAAKPSASATGAAPPAQTVDVEAVLNQLNAKSQQKLNWQTSIVDLMKLVGMDSSLQHRKELAGELGYTSDTDDSAAMNIWLHKAVMQKLAANGGKVPANLRS
jgi:Domain of unknown function (DUF3597)